MAANNPTAWSPNNLCDIVHAGAGGTVHGVPCFLSGNYERHEESGEGDPNNTRFTHTMLVPAGTDIRDEYDTGAQLGSEDVVYVPNAAVGTAFNVVFVETKAWGSAWQHLKVYLDRQAPNWPTKNL
jgi:hypothetical protein